MKQQAFTLMEVIVIAIIIGLLAMMILPSWTKTVNRSHAHDVMRNLIALYAGQQNYYQNHGDQFLSGGNLSALNSGLDLGISGGTVSYSCDAAARTCTADATSDWGFTMVVSIDPNIPANASTGPVYCGVAVPTASTSNPCCPNGTANMNCP